MMQALGVDLVTIDRCQNHILPGSKVRRAYMHHDYADETRSAWEKLDKRIDAILNDESMVAQRETDPQVTDMDLVSVAGL